MAQWKVVMPLKVLGFCVDAAGDLGDGNFRGVVWAEQRKSIHYGKGFPAREITS
jgi:hypothetical protein